MPSIANIIVKANDGVTNVTYTAVRPSGGDRAPAEWRSLSSGAAPAHQALLRMVSQDNGPRTARRHQLEYLSPYVVTIDGRSVIEHRITGRTDIVVPNGVPTAFANESIAQMMNLWGSVTLGLAIQSGYAPT